MLKRENLIGIIVAIALVGFILYPYAGFQSVVSFVRNLFSPLTGAAVQGAVRPPIFFQTLAEIGQLAKENQALQVENSQLKARIVNLEEVKKENQRLREELNLNYPTQNTELLFAKVIARSPFSFNQTLFLNVGRQEKVRVGDPVMTRGYLIGKISEVDEHSSRAILVTSHRFLMPVLLSDSRALGMLKAGLTGVVVEQIPLDIKIKPNETVLTADILPDMPSNLPIGKISHLISSSSKIFQRAAVKLPFDVNLLESVVIFKRSQ